MLVPLAHRFVLSLALIAALLMGVADSRLAAQGSIGSILGTVTDSTGSVVPGATVIARNTGTGAVQTTVSDSAGRYTIPALPVGDYDVQAELQGFQTVIRPRLRLSVGADVVVDFRLPVGEIAEALTVTAAAPLVNTTSSALGTVIDPTQIRELPLNGRNFEELVLLAPGVNVSRGSGAVRNAFTGKQEYWTVSGSRPNGQEILMDGTNIQTYQNRGTGTGILGTSLGSCLSLLTAAHEPLIRAQALNHISPMFADVVWRGLSTAHVRTGLNGHLTLDRLRALWMPISPQSYLDRIHDTKTLLVYAKYDLTFPVDLSRALVNEFARRGLDHQVVALPCGHYSTGMTPFKFVDG